MMAQLCLNEIEIDRMRTSKSKLQSTSKVFYMELLSFLFSFYDYDLIVARTYHKILMVRVNIGKRKRDIILLHKYSNNYQYILV